MSSAALVDVWDHAPPEWDGLTRFVALTLADHMSRHTGSAFPSLTRLETITGMGRTTIRRKLREIEAAGWISCEPQYTATGRQTSNLWIWHGPPAGAAGGRRPERPGGGGRSGRDGAAGAAGSREEPVLGTSNKELPSPPPRCPQPPPVDNECEHGAPHRGRLCIECRGQRIAEETPA